MCASNDVYWHLNDFNTDALPYGTVHWYRSRAVAHYFIASKIIIMRTITRIYKT